MIHIDEQDGVSIVRMVRGRGNAMHTEFLEALAASLDDVARSSTRALVITGEGKIFSAGVDLPAVTAGGADYLAGFLPALTQFLRKLALFPKPTIAAVNGHAIAGGCIGVLACDYRVMAEGNGRLGLTELLVGVPFPTWAFEIARFGIPARYLQQVVYTGQTYLPAEALERGMIDEVVPADNLLERAVEVARRWSEIPPQTFALTKRHLRAPLVERAEARVQRDDVEVSRLWGDPEIGRRIEEFVARTVKRGG